MADIKILTESELRTLVPLDNNVVDCIARAFSELAGGYVTMPPIMTLFVPEYSGEVCVKTANVP
ncbi:MAG: ornithine cyclodeaminase family protein, partial [Paracoccaceae bacterium]